MTDLLRSAELVSAPAYAAFWPRLLSATIDLCNADADGGSGGDDEEESAIEQLTELGGYSSAFCRLHYASSTMERDPSADVKVPAPQYLAQALAAVTAANPGRVCCLFVCQLADEFDLLSIKRLCYTVLTIDSSIAGPRALDGFAAAAATISSHSAIE